LIVGDSYPAMLRRDGRGGHQVPAVSGRLSAWLGFAAGVALLIAGHAEAFRPMELVGVACASVALLLLAPESVLALFLFAGAVKGAPAFSAAPVDLTLLSAFLVVVAMFLTSRRIGLGDAPLVPGVVIGAALASLVTLSALWAPDPAEGMHKALRFATLNLLALVAPIVLIRSRASLTRLALSMLALSLFVALTAVATGDPTQPMIIPGGDEIELGTFSAIGLIVAVTYFMKLSRPVLKLVLLGAALVVARTVILSGSRGALVSSVLALVYFLFNGVQMSRRVRRIGLIVTVVVAIVLVQAPHLAGSAAWKYKDQLFTTDTSSVVGSRTYLLERGWEIAVAHPLGIGAAGFDTVTNGLQYPHNIMLELADESGLLGVGLFCALAVAAWFARRRTPGGPRSAEALFAGSLIVLLLGEAQFSNNLDGNRPVWFAFGLALAIGRFHAASPDSRRALPQPSPAPAPSPAG